MGSRARGRGGNVHILSGQPLPYLQIMTHQTEHNIDVQRARCELAHTMNLEIDRIADMWAQRHQGRIETLGVADLQNRAAFLPGGNHAIGFFERARAWLFNQHVDAGLKQTARDLPMRFRRYGRTYRITPADERSPVGYSLEDPCSGCVS